MGDPESVDVLIVGAGLSGIGAACQLRRNSPQARYLVLEARDVSGGTWDLFRYPGIRSDSDMYTYSYGFKPWRDASSIADGHKILSYIREAAEEYDVDRHIRYRHKVVDAAWSSSENHWVVTAQRAGAEERIQVRCRLLLNCSGYYDYEHGHTPDFIGTEEFEGTLVHAQHWPRGLDYKGKKVVVIGSGATAVTLVPTMSKTTASLVMLQRTPSYIAAVPKEQGETLRKLLPADCVFHLVRWKQILLQIYVYQLSRRHPRTLRKFLLGQVKKALGPQYDVGTHFAPSYNPWDQRLCAAPDGDLFKAIRSGRAEVVTDHIERFNSRGIRLKSGRQLDADIIVLATGLNLKFAGGVRYTLDGQEVDFSEHYVYRGMMFSDIPNMAFTVGYTNSSWTLKSDLTSLYVCRLLNTMQAHGYTRVTPKVKGKLEPVPLLDFEAGYVLRARATFPKQGNRLPWKNYQNYLQDLFSLRLGRLDNSELEFSK